MWDIDLELAWMTPIYESWFARSSQMLEDIIYAFFFFCERKMWEIIIFLKLSKEKNCEESFQI